MDEILSALARLSPDPEQLEHDYVLAAPLGLGYCGRARGGNVVLLFPVQDIQRAVARRTAAIRVSPTPDVRFAFEGREWTAHAAVVECLDEGLLQTFLALAGDLAARFPVDAAEPSWENLLSVIDEWQRLLARRGKLGPDRELGLWGELKFMLDAPSPARLLEHWRGPAGALIDFDGPVKIEVKTSLSEHEHETSHDQLVALTLNDGYLISIWVEVDPSGESLPELVARLDAAVSSDPLLTRELLRAGYIHADRAAYATRYRLGAPPAWYAATAVPRVRELDEDVYHVRFWVRLSPEAALSGSETSVVWTRLLSEDDR